MLTLVDSRVEDPFLDAGCGTGFVACSLAREKLDTVVCLDISVGMIERAWIRSYKWRVDSKVHHVLGSVTALPFRDKCFSSTLSAAVIHHVHPRERRIEAFKELKRVCKGFILITLWSCSTPSNLAKVILARSRDVFVKWAGKGLRYYHLYSIGELREDLNAAGYRGFRITRWDYSKRLIKRNILVEVDAGKT